VKGKELLEGAIKERESGSALPVLSPENEMSWNA